MAPQASRVAGTVSCTYRNVPNKHHIPLMLIYQIQRLPGSFQYTFNSPSAPPSCQPTLPFFRVASHTQLSSGHLRSILLFSELSMSCSHSNSHVIITLFPSCLASSQHALQLPRQPLTSCYVAIQSLYITTLSLP